MDQVLKHVRDALIRIGVFNGILIQEIVSFYGHATPLPYFFDAKRRFFQRKTGLIQWKTCCMDLFLDDILPQAKRNIYIQLSESVLDEQALSYAKNKISIEYFIPRFLLRQAARKHFDMNHLVAQKHLYSEELKRLEQVTIDVLTKHFKEKKFLVSQIEDSVELTKGLRLTCFTKHEEYPETS